MKRRTKISQLEILVARANLDGLIAWRDMRMMSKVARELSDRASESRTLARSVSAVVRTLAAEFDACRVAASGRWCAQESGTMQLLPLLFATDGCTRSRWAESFDSQPVTRRPQ